MTSKDFTELPDVKNAIEKIANKNIKVSDVVDDFGNQYVNLVQEGGGVLGIALLGFTYVLEKANIRFWRLAGTSAGAINTLFLAAIKEKHEPKTEAILEELANADLKSFVDGHKIVINTLMKLMQNANYLKNTIICVILLFLGMLLGFGYLCLHYNDVLANILFFTLTIFVTFGIIVYYFYSRFKRRNWGLCRGIAFHNWLKDVLLRNNVKTLKDLTQKANISHSNAHLHMHDDHDFHHSDFTLISCDISNAMKVEFPKNKELYNIDESVNPADFVRASMSIPIFFESFQVKNAKYKEEETLKKWQAFGADAAPNEVSYFIDGGVVSNFPINIFHNPNIKTPRLPVVGLILDEEKDKKSKDALKSLISLVVKIFNTVRFHADKDFLQKNQFYKKHSVQGIDVSDFNWLNFAMSDEEKKRLFVRGVEAGVRFLEKFNWEDYKRDREALFGK